MGKSLIYLMFLAVHTVTDLRERRIYVAVLVLQAITGTAVRIYSGQTGAVEVTSCLPGLFCMGIGRLSGEKIGCGDGWMILVSGLYLSAGQITAQLFWAFLFACPCAAILLAAGKLSGKDEIPFAPFFLAGYVGGMLYGQW